MAYCAYTDVLKLMPPQLARTVTDSDVLEKQITQSDIEWYIDRADEMINSIVGQLYVVPLVKIIIVDRVTEDETEIHPYPIKDISVMIATAYIYKKLYSEAQNPESLPKYSEDYQGQAIKLMNQVISGGITLRGQRQLGRRYLRPESMDVNKLPIGFKELDINK